jgi:hypothetical protein
MINFKQHGELVVTISTEDFKSILTQAKIGLEHINETDNEWDYSSTIKEYDETLKKLIP